jgi:hypothetical protein
MLWGRWGDNLPRFKDWCYCVIERKSCTFYVRYGALCCTLNQFGCANVVSIDLGYKN